MYFRNVYIVYIGKVWKECTKLIFLGRGIYIVDMGENFTFCFFSNFFLYQTFFEKTKKLFELFLCWIKGK